MGSLIDALTGLPSPWPYLAIAMLGRASTVVALGLAFGVLLGVSARWAMGRQDALRALLARARASAVVARVEEACQPQLARASALLWPDRAFLAVVAVAMAVVGTAGWALAETFEAVVGVDGIARLDRPVAEWFSDHRTWWLTDAMRWVSALGGATGGLVALVVAGWAGWHRSTWRPLLVVAAALSGAVVTSQAIKHLVGRPRPTLSVAATAGFAFPSGHTTTTVAVAGAVAWLVAWHRPWRQQVACWALAVSVGAVVGFSRAYLGAHWLTDVVGGWLLGTVWLAVVVAADAAVLVRAGHRR